MNLKEGSQSTKCRSLRHPSLDKLVQTWDKRNEVEMETEDFVGWPEPSIEILSSRNFVASKTRRLVFTFLPKLLWFRGA